MRQQAGGFFEVAGALVRTELRILLVGVRVSSDPMRTKVIDRYRAV
jgi:hypothetical protein